MRAQRALPDGCGRGGSSGLSVALVHGLAGDAESCRDLLPRHPEHPCASHNACLVTVKLSAGFGDRHESSEGVLAVVARDGVGEFVRHVSTLVDGCECVNLG